ncbi:hypothetical protein EVAR_79309_1 [Eumeta japonica]|uniref:Uncharacterized protein n=1 Tax=Eumeta variegata TaxID=151549 RepID=A0A4C1THC7_EUMVA|nr:hypothetical protein EVAR_79309_1 [Eumeta japonica]
MAPVPHMVAHTPVDSCSPRRVSSELLAYWVRIARIIAKPGFTPNKLMLVYSEIGRALFIMSLYCQENHQFGSLPPIADEAQARNLRSLRWLVTLTGSPVHRMGGRPTPRHPVYSCHQRTFILEQLSRYEQRDHIQKLETFISISSGEENSPDRGYERLIRGGSGRKNIIREYARHSSLSTLNFTSARVFIWSLRSKSATILVNIPGIARRDSQPSRTEEMLDFGLRRLRLALCAAGGEDNALARGNAERLTLWRLSFDQSLLYHLKKRLNHLATAGFIAKRILAFFYMALVDNDVTGKRKSIFRLRTTCNRNVCGRAGTKAFICVTWLKARTHDSRRAIVPGVTPSMAPSNLQTLLRERQSLLKASRPRDWEKQEK